jgi:hypothetical protein
MFTLAGWLFADMFLAMTMIFLFASAIGTYIPKTPTHSMTPTPRLIGMDTTPVTVGFTVDVNGLLNNDPAVVAQVKSQVQNQLKPYLSKHVNGKAAFVSTFGGGTDDRIDTTEASNVNKILHDMGKHHYVFDRSDTVYKQYVDRSAKFGAITIDIFFYLYTK